MGKKFVLNAVGLGMSKAINRGIAEALDDGILKSASLTANGAAFDDAVNTVISKNTELGIGVCLNITTGHSICTDLKILTDSKGNFKNTFWGLLINSVNPKNKEFTEELEREFRRQIEKVMAASKVNYIESFDGIHIIPGLYNLVCKLAKEYNIAYVISHYEKLYIVPEIFRHFKFKFFLNIFRTLLFNFLTLFDENIIHKYELKTNDYILGGIYKDMMDSLAVSYGIASVRYEKVLMHCSIHPCRYDEGTIDEHFNDFLITKNMKLKTRLEKAGFEITNYVEKET